jgi:hypothetical protein
LSLIGSLHVADWNVRDGLEADLGAFAASTTCGRLLLVELPVAVLFGQPKGLGRFHVAATIAAPSTGELHAIVAMPPGKPIEHHQMGIDDTQASRIVVPVPD